MDRFVENPTSCHSTQFKYSLAGNNPGTLSLVLQSDGGVDVRPLWSTAQVTTSTTGWEQVSLTFRYWGRFRVSGSIRINSQLIIYGLKLYNLYYSDINAAHNLCDLTNIISLNECKNESSMKRNFTSESLTQVTGVSVT